MAQPVSPSEQRKTSLGQMAADVFIVFVAVCVLAVPIGTFWGAMVAFQEAGLLGLVPLAAGIVVLGAAYYVIKSLAVESPLLRRIVPGMRG